jgi:uncharacterized repeat protein (TIGR01451 family)
MDNRTFDVFLLKDSLNQQHLFIQIHNIPSLLDEFGSEQVLSLKYEINAVLPKKDKEYNFPSTLLINFNGSNNNKKYILPQDNLPKLNVIHNRRKISLGKIVDNYDEANKFIITLLVRNTSNTAIENLEIIDTLPKSVDIFNAGMSYVEKLSKDNFKQILFKVEYLGPFQSIEISYLIDTKGIPVDLNIMDLIFN